MKKKTKIFTAVLAVLILLMSFPISVFADDTSAARLSIDLRDYPYDLSGTLEYGEEADYTAPHGTLSSIGYEIGGADDYLLLKLMQNSSDPTREWIINGDTYTLDATHKKIFLDYYYQLH